MSVPVSRSLSLFLFFVHTPAFHVVFVANAGCAENDIEMFAAQLQ